jgi:type I restriction enzyme M protein
LSTLTHLPGTLFKNRNDFEKALGKVLKGAGVTTGTPIKKAILTALSEHDETADICLDADGKPEPDTELRDFELVPLMEDWRAYIAREVTPFVPDAWVDETYMDDADKGIGRVGYEISFTRYFYRYSPPRPLGVIDEELKKLEAEISALLAEVASEFPFLKFVSLPSGGSPSNSCSKRALRLRPSSPLTPCAA